MLFRLVLYCLVCSTSLTVSLVSSDSNPDLVDISRASLVSPSSASDSTVVDSAVPKPISLANIVNKFKSSGYNPFGVPCDSDTTVPYSSMSDDENGPVGGTVNSATPGVFNPDYT